MLVVIDMQVELILRIRPLNINLERVILQIHKLYGIKAIDRSKVRLVIRPLKHSVERCPMQHMWSRVKHVLGGHYPKYNINLH